MADNKDAVYLAKYFFEATQRRATQGTMAQSIGQAKALLDAGFTVNEIKTGVDWCITHPPKKGFNSLGWLSYDLENILKKAIAKTVRDEINNICAEIEAKETTQEKLKPKTSEERVRGKFSFDMFDDGS